jgi:hypothetical protein
MMKVPHSINRASSASILASLFRRHDYEATRFREAAKAVPNAGQADFFRSLAHYRHELLTQLRKAMEDFSATVNTPVKDAVSSIQEAEADWNQALQTQNVEQIATMVYEAEKGTSDYYRKALDKREMLDSVRTLLEQQHETSLQWLRKADRFRTVPQQRNNDFK